MRLAGPYFDEHEVEAVVRALRSGQWASGAEVSAVEQELSGLLCSHECVAVSSGTAALHAALACLGIGPGDRVVVPAFSFAASANCVLHVGARPVFVDVDEHGILSVPALERVLAAVASLRAVVVVHLYGRPAPMTPITALARRHGLGVVEDCAQALGAAWEGRPAGCWGDAGCLSFYATKNAACGEGGMVVTRHCGLAERVRRFINHGQVRRYEHLDLGYNYRLTDLQAALLRVQVHRLAAMRARRAAIARQYQAAIENLVVVKPEPAAGHAHHLYTVRCLQRDALAAHLAARGIPTAVHYPAPIPAQPLYRALGYDPALYPTALELGRTVLSLPLHPGLEHAEVEQVVAAVNSFRP